ncbi:sphingoid long-chain bases kinase 1-like isoform X2 [Ananas comosus]|uniref:Sphingoid long-chain bases kinase 1-like isoform X2 n=1 Tax=Ananas comosus TaxID=4615 RepID=A0A6P5H0N0_ANACO|nr:sphingoid long-chain bases kinase 1-like isoform X2 [Ananas comosus]
MNKCNQYLRLTQLAGFRMKVVETGAAGHAKNLASTVDLGTCPDGIICVGGDGIVNEVLNGLLSRVDTNGKNLPPIGIVPAGSDNSLAWSVLGVRDPIPAALSIVKGGSTAVDVFACNWPQAGVTHFGVTASYFGFLGDVLELSEKYRVQFGPLRYFIAGVLKFLSLPEYSFELEYLPSTAKKSEEDNVLEDKGKFGTLDQSDDFSLEQVKELNPDLETKWVRRKGRYLGILVCNHSCKTAQSLSSEVVAPKAEHDDNSLDLILVHGSGRMRLLRFFVDLQFGQHLSLPFVEYVKVKSVKIKPIGNTHNGCGIDGELLRLDGQVVCSLLPEKFVLLGCNPRDCK